MTLRDIRKSRRLTQRETAKQAGISSGAYCLLELGKVDILKTNLSTLSKIAGVFEMSLAGLLYEIYPEAFKAPDTKEKFVDILTGKTVGLIAEEDI